MRVVVGQFAPRFGDVIGNVDRVVGTLGAAEGDLYVFPELALSGYLFESKEEALSLAQEPGGSEFDPVAGEAASKGAAVVLGFAERSGGSVFNSSIMIGPDGAFAVYRKLQLFLDEKDIFEPGDRPPEVVEAGGARLGMMVCFDWIFPEVARTLALAGADILCHPSNLVLPYCQDAMVTRCIESRVFAVTANRVGAEERAGRALEFTGMSQVVSPTGRILARAGGTDEEVLVVDIDPADARDKAVTPANDVLADRRPGLYRLG
jgi:predicted amidohydrolase